MDRIKLRNGLLVGVGKTLGGEVALSDKDDQPGHIQPASFHLWQGDLRVEVHRVVVLGREVDRIDVVVGV